MKGDAELADYDWQGMAKVLKGRATGHRTLAADVAALTMIFAPIQHMAFPPGYLASLRKEMIEVLQAQNADNVDRTFVYLTFFGQGWRASHMKIGIAKDVRSRISSIRTGNPLLPLWTFAAPFGTRQSALAVEGALLRHMAPDRSQGEWVNVYGMAEDAAKAVAESLAELARAVSRSPAQFEPVEV